jgi:cytochrome P450
MDCTRVNKSLNTPKAVFDLLDKRGSLYSDKPHLVMAGELCGCENMATFTPYGDRARRQRKLMQKAFGPAVIPRNSWLDADREQTVVV